MTLSRQWKSAMHFAHMRIVDCDSIRKPSGQPAAIRRECFKSVMIAQVHRCTASAGLRIEKRHRKQGLCRLTAQTIDFHPNRGSVLRQNETMGGPAQIGQLQALRCLAPCEYGL